MKSKTSICTTTYLLLIVFCTLFVYIVVRKMHNVQLQEGLKMKGLNKVGKKILQEARDFTIGLVTVVVSLLFIGVIGIVFCIAIIGAFNLIINS